MGKFLVAQRLFISSPDCKLDSADFPLFPWAKSFLMLVVSFNNLTSSQLFLK